MAAINLPFAASATKRAPNADELANGFPCGDADKQLFDWLEWWLTGQIATAITEGGLTVDDALLPRLAQAIQSGKSTYAVATGTANAWVISPSLAVPAYAAGRVLNVIAPATNTSTTVNANISGLGNRPIVKGDGSVPQPSDLVSGRVYATIDDGTSIRVLTTLPSDRLAQPYLGFHGGAVSTSAPSSTQILISSYTGTSNNIPGSAQSGGIVTIGTSGFYQVTANLQSLLADWSGNNYGAVVSVSKVDGSNNPILSLAACPIEVIGSNVPSSRAAAASGIAKLTVGDRIAVFFKQTLSTAQNVSISFDIEFRGA